MLLAEAAAAATQADMNWINGLMFFSNIILTLTAVWKVFGNRKEPELREVTFAEQFARKEDLTRVESEVKALESKIEAIKHGMVDMEHRISKAGEERAVSLHERINQLVNSVGEVNGQLKIMNQEKGQK